MFYFVVIKIGSTGAAFEGLFVDGNREVAKRKAEEKMKILKQKESDKSVTYEVREAVGP